MATRIPILPGGGVPALDFTSLGNLPGEIMRDRRQQRLTAERLQDISEARGDRQRQREGDMAFSDLIQNGQFDLATPGGQSALGQAVVGLGGPQNVQRGMTFMDRASAMRDAALNRQLTQARIGEVGAGRRERAGAREDAATAAANARSAAVQWAVQNGVAPDLASANQMADAGFLDDAAKVFFDAQKPGKPQSAVGKIQADITGGFVPEKIGQAALNKATTRSDGITVSPDGTVQIGGKPTTQAKNDARKAEAAFKGVDAGLTRFDKLFKEEGFAIPGTRAARNYKVARRGLQLQLKELFNLGVLNGPDLTLMDEMLLDPSSKEAVALMAQGEFENTMKQSIGIVRETITDMRNSAVAGVPGFEQIPQADAATGAPQAGTVEDGFRFKGGDPADPNNWEKAQ